VCKLARITFCVLLYTPQVLLSLLRSSPPPPAAITCSALMLVGNFLYDDNHIPLPLTTGLVHFCLRLCERGGFAPVAAECIESMRVLACIMYERSDIDDETSCAVVSSVTPFICIGSSMDMLRHACDCVGNIVSKKGEAVQPHLTAAAASVAAVFEHLSSSSSVTADRAFQSSIRTLRLSPPRTAICAAPVLVSSSLLFLRSILVGEASGIVARRKHDVHPSSSIGGDASVAVMVKTVCRLLCSSSPSVSFPSPPAPAPQPPSAAASTPKGRRNRHSRVQGMSESEVSDAGGGGGGPVDAATTIDGKSRLHLLTCLLHLVRLVPRCIQPHWLQVPTLRLSLHSPDPSHQP